MNKYDSYINKILMESDIPEGIYPADPENIDDIDDVEDLTDIIDIYDGITNVERSSSINILRDKEPNSIYIKDDMVVGVLWDSFDNGKYSFDVVVLPEYQRSGIAKKLIDSAMANYSMFEDSGAVIELDVVNPQLAKYLKSIGFETVENIQGHEIMRFGER